VFGRERRQPLDERDADVAAEHGTGAERRREQRVGERGGRRLALRARDPDGRGRAQPEEQVHLRDERRGGGVARRASRDEVGEDRAEARLRGRVVGVDRRRGGHQGRAGDRRRGIDVGTQEETDLAALQAADGAPKVVLGPRVVHGHDRAGVDEEAGQGDPRAGEAEDAHRAVAEDVGGERARDERRRVDDGIGGHDAHSRLIDARKSVTPISPAMMPTIQKRSVIFSSSQPCSS
jgi:hypothetical protein